MVPRPKDLKLKRAVSQLKSVIELFLSGVTDGQIDACCGKLNECLYPILRGLSQVILGEHRPFRSLEILNLLSCCFTEHLIHYLIPIVIVAQSWGLTSDGASPSKALRLQTWRDGMSVLMGMFTLADLIQDEYPQAELLVLSAFMPCKDEPPGGHKQQQVAA